ncbi:MDR family MFS transporter [Pseudonocardia acaciae]|uniref:MDR family MFS transporter n=1 Tax=Pseudonocardia acaciae TaxID=551276 RepID=UPI0007E8D23F|nr:MDR family MFS transporter [Pseudonocardia acaciae]
MEVATAPPPPSAPADESSNGWLIPMLVLIGGMFMSLLDMTIVNVAIPTMQRDFGVATDDVEWISTAFTLGLGVVVPLSGWLGDRLGLTKVYLACLVGFAVASALCGLAWNLGSMVAFRILQAVPGGILPVITMSMIYVIVPREKMGSAMGLFGLGVVFGPAAGPTLGGYLVEYLDWRLIFYINVPVAVLATVAAWFLIPKMAPTTSRRFDWWGFITSATGLFALLLAFSEGESWGWGSYRILMLIVGALLLLALFVVIELELDEPLIDLRVFKNWMFTNSLLLIMVLIVGLFGVLFYLPLFMQADQGTQPLRTGLILLPEALVMGVLMPIAGRLYDLIGPRWPAVIGLAIAAWGGFLLCGINPDMTDEDVILWTCIRAFGNGLAMMPIMTAGMSAVPPGLTTSASLMNNVAQRVASALGLAALTVIASSQSSQLMSDRSALMPANDPRLSAHGISQQDLTGLYGYYQKLQVEVTAQAYSDVFLVAAILTTIGIVLAMFMKKPPIPDEPAAQPAEPAAGAEPTERSAEATPPADGTVRDREPVP